MQIPCGVCINTMISKNWKKLKQEVATKIVINFKKDSIEGQTETFKVTNLKIQTTAWRYDRGI